MNRVFLTGRLLKDPETKYTQNGKAMARFTLAVRKYSRDAQKEESNFISVVAWDKMAEVVENYLSKGKLVMVEGSINSYSYEAPDKSKRYITNVLVSNIEFMDSKKSTNTKNTSQNKNAELIPFDEDVPF